MESLRNPGTLALPYVAALDGLRAFAVAGVLLYHGGVPWLPGGFLGVDLFFVLSGFLITSLLLRELDATGGIDLRRFWTRRARRLLPAAFLVIAVCLVVAVAFMPGEAARVRTDALASFAYVGNWAQIVADRSYFAGFERPSLLQHLWSLAVEEQFYLLWPLLLVACLRRFGRRGAARLALAGAITSAVLMAVLFTPGQDPSRVYFGTDTHASGLLIGVLLAFLWPLRELRSAPKPGARLLLDAGAVAGLAAVVVAMATWHDYDPIVYRGGLLAFAIAAAALIGALAHPACRVARVAGAAPLRWIGQRSYGIYLWHWPVMALTRPEIDVPWSRAVLLPLQIAATVALAAASYRWVEQPFRSGQAGRELKAWLDRRTPRRRLAIAMSGLLAFGLATAWTAGAGAPPQRTAFATAPTTAAAARLDAPRAYRPDVMRPARDRKPLAVGASVMLAAQQALARHATVDAAVARQPSDVVARLDAYRAAQRLPSRVVVQIGENGPLWSDDMRALRHALRGVERVVIVNVRVPRSWVAQVNETLEQAAASWPAARVVDWYEASARGGLLYEDATHPTARGARVYASLVERALGGVDCMMADTPCAGRSPR